MTYSNDYIKFFNPEKKIPLVSLAKFTIRAIPRPSSANILVEEKMIRSFATGKSLQY